MRIKLSRLAERDLAELREFVASDNKKAADEVSGRIVKAFLLIRDNPLMGRPSKAGRNNREWSVPNLPYIIAYKVRPDVLYILRIYHTSRLRPNEW